MKRLLGWPEWPAYTGWHTQQLCKLIVASEVEFDTVVVIDSDVIISPSAAVSDFISINRIVCYAEFTERKLIRGKLRNWILESERLAMSSRVNELVNTYFDTPFIFHKESLKKALGELSSRIDKAWYYAFLESPPRRWSEFGFYKAYLLSTAENNLIEWRSPSFCRYIYDASNPSDVVNTVLEMLDTPDIHYITIHSQASGRKQWDSTCYLSDILEHINISTEAPAYGVSE
ncbi:MAG: hypothetical protein HWE24_20070 [Oceanospirillaceae bacterium]|nr:hypothetical protein [Oceanospirillaceae bacterium]